MDGLIKLVKTYRLTSALADRLRLGDEIFAMVEPGLRLFVRGSLGPSGEDTLQEILKASGTDLMRFKGETEQRFWAWCYRIVRNKLSDHFRKQAANRR